MKKSFRFFFLLIIIPILFQSCNDEVITPQPDPDKPIANAGIDRNIFSGQYLNIDGSQSEKKSGDTLTYLWSENQNNPSKNIIGNMAFSKIFTATFPIEGSYTYYLVVNNGKKESDKDSLVINVLPRQQIIFPDTYLEISIRFKLGKPTEEINESDLLSITSLNGLMAIINYEGIEKCKNIKTLSLKCAKPANFTKIELLENLKQVGLGSFYEHKIHKQNITPILNNPSLDSIYIHAINISDINIANDKQLEFISIYFCDIQTTSFLTKLKSLKHLDFEGSKISNLIIPPELTSLVHIDLQQQGLTTIPYIPETVPINTLMLSVNQLTSISNLVSCKKITKLYLDHNKIEDITLLSELSNLEILSINHNLVKDIHPLLSLNKLKSVSLSSSTLNEKSINEYIPALRTKGVNVILYN